MGTAEVGQEQVFTPKPHRGFPEAVCDAGARKQIEVFPVWFLESPVSKQTYFKTYRGVTSICY